MPSQIDLDQGGSFRQWERVYLGPSIGWVLTAGGSKNQLNVTTAGITTAVTGTTLVQVSVNGSVTIILPPTLTPNVPGVTEPGFFARPSITVLDVGGFANAHPITIQPAPGELIMGLASIQITSQYGGFILQQGLGNWINVA